MKETREPKPSPSLTAEVGVTMRKFDEAIELFQSIASQIKPDEAISILGEDRGREYMEKLAKTQEAIADYRKRKNLILMSVLSKPSKGSDIEAAQRQIGRLSDAIKEGIAKKKAKKTDNPEPEADEAPNKNEGVSIPQTPVWRDAEKVIETGSLYELAVLYLNNLDMGRTFNFATLTDDQNERIRAKIYSPENFEEGIVYARTYNAFLQYGNLIKIAKYGYEREAKELTGLINLWESYKSVAEQWKRLIQEGVMSLEDGSPLIAEFGKSHGDKNTLFPDMEIGTGNGTLTIWPDGNYTLDIGGEGQLYEQIQEQAERTAHELSKLKGFIEPLSNYIYDEGEPPLWPILPSDIERWMDYPDAIKEQSDKNKEKYFRFRLRQRMEDGETITPEEEYMAVYPDYNEVEIDETTEPFAKQQLTDIFYIWNVKKRAKTAPKRKRGRPRKQK